MTKLQGAYAAIALTILFVTVLVLPARSIEKIDLSVCSSDLLAETSCISGEQPFKNIPLLLILTSSQDLLAPEATSDINRNILVGSLLGAGFYLVATKPNMPKRKKHSRKT